MSPVPALRVRAANDRPVVGAGDYVLYWMIASRRTRWNYAIDRAMEWARELKKPILIFEALRAGYPWASDRTHRFAIDGMAANQQSFAQRRIAYYPYVEPTPGAGRGLLESLAARACVVVTDDFPAFFLPRMVAAAAERITVLCEQVDANGLLPLRAADRVFATAYAFRRFLQRELPAHLADVPRRDPFAGDPLPGLPAIDAHIFRKWPPAAAKLLAGDSAALRKLPIDHAVPVAPLHGGEVAAVQALDQFLGDRLPRYSELRNEPSVDATSGLSAYLHFGHIAAHEVFSRLAAQEAWAPASLGTKAQGKRSGWWGMSESAEAFLDQLVTWRELGYNFCARRDDYDKYESLPDWAQATLARHARDRREHVYTLDEFAAGATHDPLWNAAQCQLRTEGRLHNYLRMLWGKKIVEWTATPQDALDVMIELNNKYALDGRDPNSYSGIFWVLGRYDRPWGPERPIFGTVRFMSSQNTARKLNVKPYLARYGVAIEQTPSD